MTLAEGMGVADGKSGALKATSFSLSTNFTCSLRTQASSFSSRDSWARTLAAREFTIPWEELELELQRSYGRGSRVERAGRRAWRVCTDLEPSQSAAVAVESTRRASLIDLISFSDL